MSAVLYDDALLRKLKKWTDKTSMHIYGVDDTERLFEIQQDKSGDEPIKLPILCLRRVPGGFTVTDTSRKPMSFDGAAIDKSNEKTRVLNSIPISLQYQLDVYARYKVEVEEYARNLVFNIVNYPKLEVIIPYMGVDYVHNSSIKLSPNVDDNSDIPERLSFGQFTRYTLGISVDDAYLWDVRDKDNYTITTRVLTDEEEIIPCDC